MGWSVDKLRLNLKMTGWWPALVSAVLLAGFVILDRPADPGNPVEVMVLRRAVETVAPLLFAVQVAFLVGPDNEPALELLCSAPRPLWRIYLERLSLVIGMHVLPALAVTAVIIAEWGAESPGIAVLRWLGAGIALGGLAVLATQLTRHGVFSILLITAMWAASLYGGDMLLMRWPWAWPLHVYLQPEKFGLETYLLNRTILVLAGSILFLLTLRLLGDEERMLGGR